MSLFLLVVVLAVEGNLGIFIFYRRGLIPLIEVLEKSFILFYESGE